MKRVETGPRALPAPPMLAGSALEQTLRRLTFTAAELADNPALQGLAARRLRRHGVIRVRAAVDGACLVSLQPLVAAARHHASNRRAGDPAESVLVNVGECRAIRGYRRMVASPKAIISVRQDEDEGMLDVFHPEKLLDSLTDTVIQALQESLVRSLLEQAFHERFHVHVRNLYLNSGVTSTRGLHTDGGGVKAKAFLYLTDVPTLAEGPFCYVPGSHRRPWLRWLNRLANKRQGRRRDDCAHLLGHQVLPVFCQAGDLVIAMQQGIHRGHPQAPGAERAVLLSMLQPSMAAVAQEG